MTSIQTFEKRKNSELHVSKFVPFGAHVADDLVKLRDGGGYVATWKLQGISFRTAEEDDIKARHNQLNNFLASLSGGHYALYSHRIGRYIKDQLEATYENPFCAEFAEAYNEALSTKRQFQTELYVSVIYRPYATRAAKAMRKKNPTPHEMKDLERIHRDEFQMACEQVLSSLAPYDPVRLSTYEKNNVVYSEQLRFYGYLLNCVWENVPLRSANVANYLPSSRIFPGDNNGIIEIHNFGKKRFVSILEFAEYPTQTEPGMNNAIFYGDYEYIETQSFAIINKREALKILQLQQKRLTSSDDASATEVEGITVAMDLLQQGLLQFGDYHYSLSILGDSIPKLIKSMASAKSALEEGPGYRVVPNDVVPEAAWFAQLPGNFALRPRNARISSRNYAAMAPLHNFPTGKRDGNPWGQAIALFESPSGQPFYFNFHVSPPKKDSLDEKLPGNTTVLGTTGVGKTTLVMALLSFATKVKNMRAIFFDKDRGGEIAIRAMGGNYRALRYGERTGFNPFQFEPTAINRDFCKKLVSMIVTRNGEPLTVKDEDDISRAVESVFAMDKPLRRIASVAQLVPSVGENSLKNRLRKWVGDGDNAWVFDNARDTTDLSNGSLFGFDYTEFLEREEVRPLIIAYLLHITETLIDGRPFIYFMEEFWKAILDQYFRDFAMNKQKTIRKQNGLGVFITQSPSDVLRSQIGKTMVEQSVTIIALPNPRADYNEYVNEFHFTPTEYEIIVGLSENSRMFLVKQNGRSALVKMDLAGMPKLVNILSGTTDNVELLDGIREEFGDDPEVWIPKLHEAIAQRKAGLTSKKTA